MALDFHTATALAQLPTRGVCELATAASFLDCAPLLEIAISNLAERLGSCNLPHEIRALFDMPERDSPQAPYCAPQATAPQATFARAAADSKGVDPRGVVCGNAAGDALINGGRIEKPVTNHNAASLEGGSDFFANELGAAGGEEEEFGLGHEVVALWCVLEEVADRLSGRGATRLADQERLMARLAEMIGEEGNLSRFSAAFRAFECNEKTGTRHI
jgi:hypothetical protein